MTILVVDDEPEYRLILRTLLVSHGWNVVLAENGEDALARLEETPVDMVITDIYMPVMDGIKFHKQVRTIPKYEQLPFLFVSAFDDQHTVDVVKDPRFEAFLRKVRPVEEMIEWIVYLTTPEEMRQKNVPTPGKPSLRQQSRGSRGSSGTPIL